MSEEIPENRNVSWHAVAVVCGMTRAGDLPFLLWPLLWGAWIAGAGAPNLSRLIALVASVLLARSAAWAAYMPEATALREIPRERHLLVGLFAAGALCFALPLGWPGLLVPGSLGLVAAWFVLRQSSYLSDPLLAAALTLLPVAAWLGQAPLTAKPAGLLLLAVFLWILAALINQPFHREGANLSALAGARAHITAFTLRITALAALALAGRQADFQLLFWLGFAGAAGLTLYQFWTARRPIPPSPTVLEAWWGAALFGGIALHFFCSCRAAA